MNTFYKSFNFTWALSLFGTAVGAGVLFLPINAGMGGFWPLIIMTILVGPMTYFAHRGLARFVLSSKNPGQDITYVVQEHFGKTGGRLITLLYFLAIYPILLIYGVGITNTVISFMEHQMHMAPPPRSVVSFVLIAIMVGIMLTNENFILKVTNWLVYPLIAILSGLTLYLIPHWTGNHPDMETARTRSYYSNSGCCTIYLCCRTIGHRRGHKRCRTFLQTSQWRTQFHFYLMVDNSSASFCL